MKEKLKERGITLIALVVTIVILLILAGVTLNLTLSGNGLFSRAQNAVDRYKKAQEDEKGLMEQLEGEMEKINFDYNNYVGAYVTGYTPKTGSCEIGTDTSGTSSAQPFTTDTTMKWRIWDYDGRILRLISDKPTSTKLQLTNVKGYNNGIWAVNEIARKCYSNEQAGVSVANLKRSDIQKVTKYDYTQYSHDNNNSEDKKEAGTYKYGNTKTYSNGSTNYPEMWNSNDKYWTYKKDTSGTITGGDKEGLIWEREGTSNGQMTGAGSGNNTEFKQSYWRHDYDTSTANETDWINTKYYDLLFGDSSSRFNANYWLACRYTYLDDSFCTFGLQLVGIDDKGFHVWGDALYNASR